MNILRLSSILFLFLVAMALPPAVAQDSALPKLDQELASGERPVKIVCFGDSVTGLYYHTGGVRTYTDMLGIALRQIHTKADVTMINAGISGHTTVNALARIEKDVLSHHPDLVTVMFGLNDMVKVPVEGYRKNLIEIVRQCRAAGAEVILCTPNAVITTPNRPVEKLIEYCEVVRAVAREYQVPLSDSFAEFEAFGKREPDAWRLTLSDEIHPNMAGHKRIAEQIARTITGKAASLAAIGPPGSALERTAEKLKAGNLIKVLAMPPFDGWVTEALARVVPGAKIEVVSWPIKGMSLFELRKDASHRVRPMKPDLVLIAVPRSASAESRESFIHDQMWIANYSQSFGKKEWDVVVIHPSLAEPNSDASESENDALIRSITPPRI